MKYAFKSATGRMAELPPAEKKWIDDLTTWRQTLCDELLALPPRIRDKAEMGRQQNLTLSIRVIDFGLGVLNDPGYDLTTLRLGQLMRASGYEPRDADPTRNYSGVMPWFGSMKEIERRAAAQATLDDVDGSN